MNGILCTLSDVEQLSDIELIDRADKMTDTLYQTGKIPNEGYDLMKVMI